MSIKALEELTNGKDTVLALLQEHYIMGPVELSEVEIRNDLEHNESFCKNIIVEHGLWRFCYHRDSGVLYLL